jgi:RimK-like ATP-grasp domain
MILICGIPSESPIQLVSEALDELGIPYTLFNQRLFADTHIHFEIINGQVIGMLLIGQQHLPLEDIVGVYTRLMDDQSMPELRGLPMHAPERLNSRALHDTLSRWIEITPARVVNRSTPMGSNASKPYQLQLISEHGFAVPETLITNDPELVQEFHAQHGHVIYKSISSVRSIVQMLQPEDYKRLEHIRWCPTQFQAFVEGNNVRVHVVDREVFATKIISAATDYRYAHQQGSTADLFPIELDAELTEKCIHLAHALNLPFAGIDLKITPNNQVYCFEVNPSPGFSYFEAHTGQPIANAVARYLAAI